MAVDYWSYKQFDTLADTLYDEWCMPNFGNKSYSLDVTYCVPYAQVLAEAGITFDLRHVHQVFQVYTLTSGMTTTDITRRTGIQNEIVRDVVGWGSGVGNNSVRDFVVAGYWHEGRILMCEMSTAVGIDAKVRQAIDVTTARLFGVLPLDEWGLPA